MFYIYLHILYSICHDPEFKPAQMSGLTIKAKDQAFRHMNNTSTTATHARIFVCYVRAHITYVYTNYVFAGTA